MKDSDPLETPSRVTHKRTDATLKVYGLVPPLPLGFQDFPFRGSKKEKENFLKSP